jgi:hypothetical protein
VTKTSSSSHSSTGWDNIVEWKTPPPTIPPSPKRPLFATA